MKLWFCFVAIVFAAAPAYSQPRHAALSVFDYASVPPAPASLSWRLATQGGSFVDFTIPQLTVSNGQIAYLVTPDTASQFGVDFNAWRTAAADPAYNRSIMTLAGATMEKNFAHGFNPFVLDRFQLFVEGFHPSENSMFIQGGLIDFLDVPEPASWLLVAMGLLLTQTRKRGWSGFFQQE